MLYRALIMLLWFVGTSVATVWIVFRDPTFVVAMTVVMLLTLGRKPIRKSLLAVVIGLFLHLVFDFAFANTAMFWWPLGGFDFVDEALPVVARGWLNAPLEVIGVVLAIWTSRQVAFAKSAR